MPKLKVACLQVSPVHGDPAGNMKVADNLLSSLSAEDGIDVLLLPEMAFSGQGWHSRVSSD
jgi:predicted amidohydrolase